MSKSPENLPPSPPKLLGEAKSAKRTKAESLIVRDLTPSSDQPWGPANISNETINSWMQSLNNRVLD